MNREEIEYDPIYDLIVQQVKDIDTKSNNVQGAEGVGKRVAERALENGITNTILEVKDLF